MSADRGAAFKAERAAMLAFCATLAPADWRMNSRAEGWSIQDVVAHLAAGCHAVFSPAAGKVLRSNDIERANDVMVDSRRDRSSTEVLAEYRRWSRVFGATLTAVGRTPLGGLPVPLADLGKFPARLMLGALVFDHHTHLRHDMAPALGRPVPGTDANRMANVQARIQTLAVMLKESYARSDIKTLQHIASNTDAEMQALEDGITADRAERTKIVDEMRSLDDGGLEQDLAALDAQVKLVAESRNELLMLSRRATVAKAEALFMGPSYDDLKKMDDAIDTLQDVVAKAPVLPVPADVAKVQVMTVERAIMEVATMNALAIMDSSDEGTAAKVAEAENDFRAAGS